VGERNGDATLVRSGPRWTIAFAQQRALPTSSQRPARLGWVGGEAPVPAFRLVVSSPPPAEPVTLDST
jgi:hypothetical protein